MKDETSRVETDKKPKWNHDSDARFTEYYEEASLSEDTAARSSLLTEKILRYVLRDGSARLLQVADVGCGPGAQAFAWAEKGHRVSGVDVNRSLIEIARRRASENNLAIEFHVGSATELPWSDGSMDVCLLPELLEHVSDWRRCLDEATRVLASGGVLYLSTSNRLCPVQREFRLPLYSWYPSWLKKRYERLAVTTRKDLVNYAPYPAVNWFSHGILSRELSNRGLEVINRFQFGAHTTSDPRKKRILGFIGNSALLNLAGQIATPYTLVVGTKR